MIMLMADQDPLARAPHAMLLVMLLQPLQPRQHRRVLFGLVLFGAEGVVAERVEPDRGGLVCGEGVGEDGAVRRLELGVNWRCNEREGRGQREK